MDEEANKKVKSGCGNERRRSEDCLLFMKSLQLELFACFMLMLCDVYAGGKSIFSPFWK